MKLDSALVDRLRELGASDDTIRALSQNLSADLYEAATEPQRKRLVVEWILNESPWTRDDVVRMARTTEPRSSLYTPMGAFELTTLAKWLTDSGVNGGAR